MCASEEGNFVYCEGGRDPACASMALSVSAASPGSRQTSPGFVRQLSPGSCTAPRDLKLSDSLPAAQTVGVQAPPDNLTTQCVKNSTLRKRERVLLIPPR